jgi:hypothetical protein
MMLVKLSEHKKVISKNIGVYMFPRSIFILFVSIILSFSSQSSFSAEQDHDIKLTFLGTGAPRPSPTRYGPSILLEAGETKILVDAGPGMRQRIFQAGGFELLTDINTVLITHLHFDHTIELPNLWLTGWLFGRKTNMKVYGPPTSVYVSFQNNGSEVIGFEQGIWQNNTWQQLNFDLSSVSSGSMSVDRVVFFFDQGMVNWDTYYIDDIGLSAAPVTISENSSEFKILSYPVPAKENISVDFTISKNSSVLIELIDINGRALETLINKNLSPNTYSYKTHRALSQGLYLIRSTINNSVYTHKVEVIK